MKIPDWVQEVLTSFDQKKEAHSELQIVDELDRVRKAHGDLSDEDFKGYVAERSAFFFRGHADKDSVWGTYFGPMAILTRTDGVEVRVPDIKELDGEVVLHWEARARSAKDPVMRARYADAVWDLKQVITNERPSHEFAQIAIDAYLLASRERLYTMEIEGVNWLKRALSLSLIHVMVPQIEHILRSFLGVLGVPTLKTVRNHPGIMDAKSMNDILSDERMREVLTENLWRYLTVLYVEKKGGLNLRNDLAHGLLPPDAFNRQIADRVFHSLLALSLMREQPSDVRHNPSPSKAGGNESSR